MKQNGVVSQPGPTLLLFIFRFKYLISGPKSYRDFRESGPRAPFLERPVNFSGRKANFKIKTSWIVAQFLAHKPVNVALLSDSFSYHFQNYWNFDLACKRGKHKQLFEPQQLPGLSRNGSQVTDITIMILEYNT